MNPSLTASRRTAAVAMPARLPSPAQLAALGTVLCLYRADSSELGGWQQATSVMARQGVDSEGLRESLCFFDARQHACWRLYLLPDSDFLAWDRLVSHYPAQADGQQPANVAERLWRRLAGRLGGDQWRLCALRLHSAGADGHQLSASASSVSSLGSVMAQRIAAFEGAEGELRIDDCCCAAASRRGAVASHDGDMPLVRLSLPPYSRPS